MKEHNPFRMENSSRKNYIEGRKQLTPYASVARLLPASLRKTLRILLVASFLSVTMILVAGGAQAQTTPASMLTIELEAVKPANVFIETEVQATIAWPSESTVLQQLQPQLQQFGLEPGSAPGTYTVGYLSFCSGFFVSQDGYIVTAAHCIDNYKSDILRYEDLLNYFGTALASAIQAIPGETLTNDQISYIQALPLNAYEAGNITVEGFQVAVGIGIGSVQMTGDLSKLVTATVVDSYYADQQDVALLKADISNAPIITVPTSNQVNVGDSIYVIGYPGAVLENPSLASQSQAVPSITNGIVSAFRENTAGVQVLQTDASITHGNSGGAAVDENGNLVGIADFGSIEPGTNVQAPGFNFLVPAPIIYDLMQRNGVNNNPGPTTTVYKQALELYYNDHYSASIRLFQQVQSLFPQHPYVAQYIANAQAAVDAGKDIPLSPLGGELPVVGLGIVGSAVVISVFLFKTRVRGKLREEQHPIPRSRFCASCGSQLRVGTKFCTKCGAYQPPKRIL